MAGAGRRRVVARVVASVLLAVTLLASAADAADVVGWRSAESPPAHNATTSSAPRHELGPESYWTISVVRLALVALFLDLAPCCAIMFLCGLAFRLLGIIDTDEFFHGLADPGIVTIGLLFIIVQPIPSLPIVRTLLAKVLQGRAPLLKLCLLCYSMSWCTNNTPLVALLIPLVKAYCREHNLAPSQYLMSMNDAALLGGTFSVIGTSTNLVYDGLMRSHGLGQMPFFEMARVALAPAVLALLYLWLAPRFLLPHQKHGLIAKLRENAPTFAAQFRVLPQSPAILCNVKQLASLLPESIRDAIMIADVRSGPTRSPGFLSPNVMSPVPPNPSSPPPPPLITLGDAATLSTGSSTLSAAHNAPTPSHGQAAHQIRCGDRLTMVGRVPDLHTAATLLLLDWDRGTARRRYRGGNEASPSAADTTAPLTTPQRAPQHTGAGLGLATPPPLDCAAVTLVPGGADQPDFDESIPAAHTEYIEVVVGTRSPIVGTFAGEGGMESLYDATLLALRRNDGQDIARRDELDEHVFEVGDTLLLLAPTTFAERHGHDFFVTATLVLPDEANPLIIEVPDACCIGRYVSVEAIKNSKKGGHGGRPEAPVPEPDDHPSELVVHVDDGSARLYGDTGAETPPSRTNGEDHHGDGTKTLRRRLASVIGGGGDDPAAKAAAKASRQRAVNAKLTKRVIVLPEAYRHASILVFLGMISAALGGVPIAVAAACAAAAMVALRLVTLQDAIKAIDFELLIMVAFSFGIGAAMNNSHTASTIGDAMADSGISGFKLLLLISIVATLASSVITAKACAQIMFPVTVAICRAQGDDPLPACILLACSTSASMFTPYGHPSNHLIFGPGGYRPMDFVKFALPLNLLLSLAMTVMTCIVYNAW